MLRSRVLRPVPGCALVLSALVLSGCSSSDSPPASAPAPATSGPATSGPVASAPATSAPAAAAGPVLTKAAYVTQADAVCDRLKADAAKLQSADPGKDPKAVAATFTRVAEVFTAAARDLSGLRAPAADATALRQKFTDPVQQQSASLQAFATKVTTTASSGDLDALRKLGPPQVDAQPDAAYLKQYGFRSCATTG